MSRPAKRPTRAEYDFIAENWARYRVDQLARMLGWGDKRVRDAADKLGLPGRRQLAQQKETARLAKQAAVKPLPKTVEHTEEKGWSDGWSIKPPTLDQLRSGGRPIIR